MEIQNELESFLISCGADEVGFCNDDILVPDSVNPIRCTIVTMIFKIEKHIISDIVRLEKNFHVAQMDRKRKADYIILETEKILFKYGYKVIKINNIQDNTTLIAPFSYKEYAVKSGLGWIGKNSLFISCKCGSGIFICSFITDAPIIANRKILDDKCGDCTLCVEKCPPKAIKNINWQKGFGRDKLINPFVCNNYRLNTDTCKNENRKDSCGICIQVCPFSIQGVEYKY